MTQTTTGKIASGDGSASTGELIQQLTEQVSRLVHAEMRLAQLEIRRKAKRAGTGAGMITAAVLSILYAIGVLLAALTLGLATGMPGWLAALLVGVFLLVVAAGLGLGGRAQVKSATPAIPVESLQSIKADIDEVKAKAR